MINLDSSNKSNEWLSWKDAFKEENEKRLNTNADSLCSFGIKPLDDALFRIDKNELLIIGADSGCGKSDLALNIARHNAKEGRTVAVFYLEGGHLEAMARIKYRDICDEYMKYQKLEGGYIELDYRKWLHNYKQCEKIHEIEGFVYSSYETLYKDNLFFYHVNKDITVDRLTVSLIDFCKLEKDYNNMLDRIYDLDLLIVDHLQYFSLDKDENEIQEITRILRTVKDITDNFNIPVVLVSHLRKKTKDRGLPGQEDFYGSSNIPKIATTAITIAPDYSNDNIVDGIYPTFFRIVKNRVGMRPNLALKVNFNIHTRSYDSKYDLYKLDGHGNVSNNAIEEKDKPKWARVF